METGSWGLVLVDAQSDQVGGYGPINGHFLGDLGGFMCPFKGILRFSTERLDV